MKKILLFLVITITIFLSSCVVNEDESYDDFKLLQAKKYSDVESFDNKYIIYYYDSTSDLSNEIKDEILDFFYNFDLLDFYLVDVNEADGVTSLTELKYTPSVVIMSSQKLSEVYSGVEEIREFITEYSNLELDYDAFVNQHITTYQEIQNISNDVFILYYYDESCSTCVEVKDTILEWAFTKNIEDIYFMNKSDVVSTEELPMYLNTSGNDSPVLVVLNYGEATGEYYSTAESIFEYIEQIGNNAISSGYEVRELDYSDFESIHLYTYDEAKTVTLDLHIEYFYSPTCSHCQLVKEDLLLMFNDLDEIPFYFLDASSISLGTRPEEYNATPIIFIIKDGEIVTQFRGSVEVGNFIDDYNNGLIDFSQYE